VDLYGGWSFGTHHCRKTVGSEDFTQKDQDPMPECSTTPLVKKLGIKPGCRLLCVHEPKDFLARLTPMPENVESAPMHDDLIDVVVLFVSQASELQKQFPKLKKHLQPAGGIWVAYPKKTSKVATDVTFEVVQKLGLNSGLVDNKVCSIDDVWTGLRFVYRKADR
jgi:hypothetical protein